MGRISDYNLFLFFTRDNGLFTWQATGTLNREARTYRELLSHLAGINFVTYGNSGDLALARELGGIQVRCNRLGLHPRLYTPLLSQLLPRFWPGPAIYKSNQVQGAEIMLAAARRTKAKTITRAGYLPSNIAAWAHGHDSSQAQRFRALEKDVFCRADRAVVTTQSMAQTLVGQYGVDTAKLRVIPNYVDTDLFKPGPEPRPGNRLCYVGRLHPEKNLDALFDAITGLDIELLMIGEGHLDGHLQKRAQAERLPVRFLGRVANTELPAHLARSSAFVFPSLGEHHPKSLIEAMSCGAPVIACQVPGVSELVEHGRTGWLSGTSPDELRQAITTVLGDASLMDSLGAAAREYCLQHLALERVIELELGMLREVVA